MPVDNNLITRNNGKTSFPNTKIGENLINYVIC